MNGTKRYLKFFGVFWSFLGGLLHTRAKSLERKPDDKILRHAFRANNNAKYNNVQIRKASK